MSETDGRGESRDAGDLPPWMSKSRGAGEARDAGDVPPRTNETIGRGESRRAGEARDAGDVPPRTSELRGAGEARAAGDAQPRTNETDGPSGSPGAGDLPPWMAPQPRRARRSDRAPLNRDQIVDAALAIVDEQGTDALSLRRLADALRVTPMSLYWHVKDKAELLELVGHRVLAEIEVPPPEGDWRQQLADVHRAMLAGFRRHPNTVEVLIGRARYGAGGIALFERILSILLGAGLRPDAAFDAYTSLYEFNLGFMTMANRSPAFVAEQRQGVGYMLTLPRERFPSIAAVAPVIGRRSLEEQFEIGLAIQIEGIAARLGAGDRPEEDPSAAAEAPSA